MHGEQETSPVARIAWIIIHLVLLLAAAWIYFGDGIEHIGARFGQNWPAGDAPRRAVLLAFGVVTWLRMTFTATVLLRRRFGWEEAAGVLTATIIYQLGFALLAAAATAPLGYLDAVGIGLFALGSFLNTGSELQRKWFKDDPANQGRLYTGGLFRLARHINYFGDSLWAAGWAILTANLLAALIPLALTAGFVLFFIPDLSKYLHKRYGEQYEEWTKHTKAFVPFVH